ncbi:MAG: diaminopimelate decarboxylase [Armatimonadota bacterium]|nr:diaminopimelate decarboxylase [Armatimonadota bacterium]
MSENAMLRANERGHLVVGGCDVVELAHKYGTPLYLYDEQCIRDRCREYTREFSERYPDVEIAYAAKAGLTTGLARLMDQEGLGLDAASAGELYTALQADFPAERIKMHGNYKSNQEYRMALEADVGRVVVDSLIELRQLRAWAQKMGKVVDVLIRIRPGVHTHTHELIQTGQVDSKFGLGIYAGEAREGIEMAMELENLRLRGLHCHIGSQLLETDSFEHTVDQMVEVMARMRDELGFECEDLDLGGGLGIRYTELDRPPSVAELAEAICPRLQERLAARNLSQPRLIVEPGRSIVGEAGVTVYTIGVVKEIPDLRTYISVDGGLSDNPRPALYDAVYEAVVANRAGQEPTQWVRVAGKHCEADTLIDDVHIGEAEPGDLLAVFATGAYTYAMASNYNRFTRPAVVLCRDGHDELLVERETLADLVSHDRVPEHLAVEETDPDRCAAGE